MKLENIDRKLKPLNKRELNNVPTLRDILIDSIGRKKPDNPRQAVGLFKLTDKVIESKDDMELSQIEFDIVKQSVEENPSGYFPYYLGQAIEIIGKIAL